MDISLGMSPLDRSALRIMSLYGKTLCLQWLGFTHLSPPNGWSGWHGNKNDSVLWLIWKVILWPLENLNRPGIEQPSPFILIFKQDIKQEWILMCRDFKDHSRIDGKQNPVSKFLKQTELKCVTMTPTIGL